ncbi:hypothetical protein [Sediminibacterium sp. C3]|uniref:beta strand repeat-containing protein n=1 Tax=Sediminibacterium sp. C3 TaxID=1267211 RepID=UPI0004194D83|nr:hypothetical protein [Sediminibacterium sp. C3]
MCKRLLVLLIFVFVSAMMRIEAQQLNYQAIARNANGVALTFRDVGIRLSIRDGSQTGSIVYSETRNVRTNQFGLFTVVIGSPGASNVLGSMASINWISGNKYLQVEIDPEGGNNYFQAGTSQLQAVPYALFANAAYPVGPAGGDLLGSNYPNPIIAPLAVTTGKIANQAITTPKIADLNVTTAKLADQAITNPKIQDNTIANIKLVNSRVTLNGLVLNLGDAQDFAIGTTGTDVNIISAGKTHTFNFPDASIANRGLITPNAQTIGGNKTFNNNITAASFIKAGGIAAQFLKADGSVDNNTYLTANQPIIVTATGDATGVSTSSGTAPVLPLTLATVNSAVGTFGNNIMVPSITVNNKGLVTDVIANPIATATATTTGLLTVGDWNTFNNKQNAISLGTSTQYFRGDLTLGNFTTDVRNQLSAGTNITYANGNIGLTNNSVTLNTLPLALGGSQSFATGNTGTDFNISSAGTVHSFNIPTASATNRGLLSQGDFSNFNAAFASRITGVTTTGSSGPATLSGNVLNIPNYTLAGLGGISSSTSLNGLALSNNQTFVSGNTGSDFNIVSSGTTHTFNIPNASASTRGLLSSADWNTFNSKQSVINGTGYGKWNGSTISFNSQIPLGTDVSGTLLAANFGALTGDVTNIAGSYTTTIANNAITNAKIADGAVTNTKLSSNGSFTLGSTSISLGGTTTTVAGLTLSSPTINTPAIYYTNTPTGLTAGANTQGSLPLTNDINIITTAAASSAVTLPTAQAGRQIIIVNRGANAINVFPAASAQINSLGTNAAFSNIPANSYAEFFATSSTQWYSANSIASSTSSWNILGNSGTSETNNFIGTTDARTLKFRVDNTFAGQINKSLTVGNTSFGFDSNDSDGTGDFNSAFGTQALRAITVGHQNSGFGAGALSKTNSGNDNTAVGQGALLENLSGDNNTGIGQGALTFNSTGTSNTALGQAALNSNTTTSNNTAVGKSALFANGGSNNTGIGHFALISNTTGNANTALGQNSLSSNTTTHNNTALGFEALKNTTNNGNVGVGYNAGVNATFSNSIAVGINSNIGSDNGIAIGAPATVGASSGNSIAIGTNAGTTAQHSIAMGSLSSGSGTSSIAIGQSANASATNAVAIGKDATNSTANTIQLGGSANTLVNATGALTATGRITGTGARFAFRSTNAATTLTINDYYLKVTANVQITLPDATTLPGQKFVIFNASGGSFNNFSFSGAQTIVGNGWLGLLSDGSVTLFSDGSNWLIEAKN